MYTINGFRRHGGGFTCVLDLTRSLDGGKRHWFATQELKTSFNFPNPFNYPRSVDTDII